MPVAWRKKREYVFCSEQCRNTPIIDRECVVCHTTFKIRAKWREGKYCSKDCHNQFIRDNAVHKNLPTTEKQCEYCGKTYRVRNSIARAQRFCSQRCFGLSNRPSGETNPNWKAKVKVVCAYCGKEFETHVSRIGRSMYCSASHRIIGNLKRLASNPRTDIERAMANALMDNGIRYDEQVLMYDKFLVDFKLQDYPVIVQCDGEYWHDRPATRARDKGQDNYLAKCGYTVLRFTDAQILKGMKTCMKQVRQNLRAERSQS